MKQSLAWSRCSVDASHSLNTEMTVPSPAGDATTSQPVVMSQPATGPASCWAATVPPWPPQPIDGVPTFTDARQPGLPAASEGLQHLPPPPRPLAPTPMPALPVQGHHSDVLQGQEHHRGWGLYGRYPKIEVELQRGVDGGDRTCAVWSREMGSETGIRRGGPPRGLALIALQVELGTLGLGQHLGCQADPCLPKAPLGMGKDLGGVREPLL